MEDWINQMLNDLMEMMRQQAEAIIDLSDRVKHLEEDAAWRRHDLDLAPKLRVE